LVIKAEMRSAGSKVAAKGRPYSESGSSQTFDYVAPEAQSAVVARGNRPFEALEDARLPVAGDADASILATRGQ
jgi:hypothetical protein